MADTARYVGVGVRALDWDDRTSGKTVYAGDVQFPGQLIAGVVRSPYPYALVRAVDVRPALDVPGVHAAIAASDFPPGLKYMHRGGALSDRPPLAGDVVRYVGEEIAAVAAETEEALEAGLRAVRVHLRPRKGPLTPDAALVQGAARLHSREGGTNVSVRIAAEWGTGPAPHATAASTAGTYEYPAVSHAPMEPTVMVAWWHERSESLELWISTQAPWFITWEVAHCLGLEQSQVVCREVAVGGGFGVKSKIGELEVLAAALSRAARRPVLMHLDRFEEFSYTKRRHAARVHAGVHADRSGALTRIDADVLLDNGAYNHMGPTVLYAAVDHFGAIYRPDVVSVQGRLVDTATQPGCPFRGYGAPQASLALESEVDRLAAAVGVDPIDFRLANAVEPFTTALNGSEYSTVGLRDCLESVRAARTAWRERRIGSVGRIGRGVAAAAHGGAAYAYPRANESEATVEMNTDGSVRVFCEGADAGTGQRTVLAQIAADELGVALDQVTVHTMDSSQAPFDMGAWSSRATHMTGNAVKLAAMAVADRLRDAPTGRVAETRTYIARHVQLPKDDGDDPPANMYADYSFAAHAAEVEVDERTGCFTLTAYHAAHDSGRIINPVQATSQVVGGVVMGMGAVLGEELIRSEGRVANASYLDYACPRAADVPDVTVDLIETPDPRNPLGTKNIAEMGVVPVGAAVCNALFAAAGIRVKSLPATPDKIIAAIAERDGRSRSISVLTRPSRWWVALVRWAYPRGLHWLLHRVSTKLSGPRPVTDVRRMVLARRVSDALEALGAGGSVIGGGTDLLVRREQGLASFETVVTVDDIPELRTIAEQDGMLVIGAAVTLAELERDERVPAVLRDAIQTIASAQVRNVATIAGNLLQEKRCWFYRSGFNCYKRGGAACPCYAVLGDHRFYHAAMGAHRCQAVTPSDVASALTALDADLVIATRDGQRIVQAGDLYDGPGETSVGPEEIVCRVRIPATARGRVGSFQKLNLYDGGFAAASVALTTRPDGDRWRDVRLVVGATAPTPWRARRTEASLEGSPRTSDGVRSALDAELSREAHPLERNGWKIDAVLGLAEKAAGELDPKAGAPR